MKTKSLLKSTIFLCIVAIFFISSISLTKAADEETTPTPTADEATVKSNLEDRVKEIVQEKLSSSEAQIKNKLGQLALVGFVGEVESVSNNSISLITGEDKLQVTYNDSTKFLKSGKSIKSDTIAIDDHLLVVGELNDKKDVLMANRISITKKLDFTTPKIYQGTASDLNNSKRTLTLTNSTGDTIDLLLSRTANLKITDLEEDQKILVIVRDISGTQVITTVKIL